MSETDSVLSPDIVVECVAVLDSDDVFEFDRETSYEPVTENV